MVKRKRKKRRSNRKTDTNLRTSGSVYLKTDSEAVCVAEQAEFVGEQRDVDACKSLWIGVLKLAVADILFKNGIKYQRKLKKHERARLKEVLANPPEEFIQSPWFEKICNFLEVNPETIRRAAKKAAADDLYPFK